MPVAGSVELATSDLMIFGGRCRWTDRKIPVLGHWDNIV